MKLYEVINIIEKAFPTDGAYEWDNVGLLVGDKNCDIQKILLVLDITEESINEAESMDCQLILSHHPMMFSGIKKINTDSKEGRIILSAAKKGINIYAAHTNCDVAPTGINAYLSELFELQDSEPLEENGLGRIGSLKEPCSTKDFCNTVKSALKLDFVRFCGDENKLIKKVAIGSGSCSDCIPNAIEKGADVMITGDTKYHTMLDFSKDIAVIDAGHYGTEIVVCEIFKKLLQDYSLELVTTKALDVYKIM